jgi:hypothetical protein
VNISQLKLRSEKFDDDDDDDNNNNNNNNNKNNNNNSVVRDGVVGIATRYKLDDPGIDSRCGRDFPHLSRPTLGPTQLPLEWVPGLSPG